MFNVISHWLCEFTGVYAEHILSDINNKIVPNLPIGIYLIRMTDKLIKSLIFLSNYEENFHVSDNADFRSLVLLNDSKK